MRSAKPWPKEWRWLRRTVRKPREPSVKYIKIDDPKILDISYDDYVPYFETSLAVREQVIRAELEYLNEKDFPRAKSTNQQDLFENSIV